MRKYFLLGGILFCLIFFFFFKQQISIEEDKKPFENSPASLVNQPLEKLSSHQEKKQSIISRSPATYSEIKNYLPKKFPSQINKRWEQKIIHEDDRYITSQLYLDGRRLEEYFYKWEKQGTELSLIAGDLPVINELTSSFPSKAIQAEKISDLLAEQAKLLSSKEVWIVDSNGKLLPFLKIEVQRSEKPKRTNGHEFWIYDLVNNSISKIIQADRY